MDQIEIDAIAESMEAGNKPRFTSRDQAIDYTRESLSYYSNFPSRRFDWENSGGRGLRVWENRRDGQLKRYEITIAHYPREKQPTLPREFSDLSNDWAWRYQVRRLAGDMSLWEKLGILACLFNKPFVLMLLGINVALFVILGIAAENPITSAVMISLAILTFLFFLGSIARAINT